MAVTIAAGVIRVLVPTLMQQVALGEQSNRLTAVEAVVSADLDWFSNYTRLWKMKTGSYSLRTDITMTSYSLAGVTSYEPSAAACTSGLAAALLADGQTMHSYSQSLKNTLKTYVPPNEIKIGDGVQDRVKIGDGVQDRVSIPISAGGVSGVEVYRNVNAVGNKIRIFYSLDGANADGLNFSREASLLVEAAAWCDRIS